MSNILNIYFFLDWCITFSPAVLKTRVKMVSNWARGSWGHTHACGSSTLIKPPSWVHYVWGTHWIGGNELEFCLLGGLAYVKPRLFELTVFLSCGDLTRFCACKLETLHRLFSIYLSFPLMSCIFTSNACDQVSIIWFFRCPFSPGF